jgi:hypothetical protein
LILVAGYIKALVEVVFNGPVAAHGNQSTTGRSTDAHLDAAVVFADCLNPLDFRGQRSCEVNLDVGVKRWLVVLDD